MQASKQLATGGAAAPVDFHLRIDYSLQGPVFLAMKPNKAGVLRHAAAATCAGDVWGAIQPQRATGDLQKDGLKLLSAFGLTNVQDRLAVRDSADMTAVALRDGCVPRRKGAAPSCSGRHLWGIEKREGYGCA